MLSYTQLKAALVGGDWTAKRNGAPIGFDDLNAGPNSVNVTINESLMRVAPDSRKGYELIDLTDADSMTAYSENCRNGFILQPNTLYLAATNEAFDCAAPLWIPRTVRRRPLRSGNEDWVYFEEEEQMYFYPEIDGRSTCGRIGLSVHQTAGRGDYGFNRPFTLELTVIEPVLIEAGQELAQIYFQPIHGDKPEAYKGAYSHQTGPMIAHLGPSRFQTTRGGGGG